MKRETNTVVNVLANSDPPPENGAWPELLTPEALPLRQNQRAANPKPTGDNSESRTVRRTQPKVGSDSLLVHARGARVPMTRWRLVPGCGSKDDENISVMVTRA